MPSNILPQTLYTPKSQATDNLKSRIFPVVETCVNQIDLQM